MMKTRGHLRARITASVVTFFVLASVPIAPGAFAAEKKQVANRSLASVSPVNASMGQGESMLRTTTKDPTFLSPVQQNKHPVKIAGVCTDNYGVRHYSSDKSYANCLDSSTRSSGSSINDYFGSAQRRAGVGLRVE